MAASSGGDEAHTMAASSGGDEALAAIAKKLKLSPESGIVDASKLLATHSEPLDAAQAEPIAAGAAKALRSGKDGAVDAAAACCARLGALTSGAALGACCGARGGARRSRRRRGGAAPSRASRRSSPARRRAARPGPAPAPRPSTPAAVVAARAKGGATARRGAGAAGGWGAAVAAVGDGAFFADLAAELATELKAADRTGPRRGGALCGVARPVLATSKKRKGPAPAEAAPCLCALALLDAHRPAGAKKKRVAELAKLLGDDTPLFTNDAPASLWASCGVTRLGAAAGLEPASWAGVAKAATARHAAPRCAALGRSGAAALAPRPGGAALVRAACHGPLLAELEALPALAPTADELAAYLGRVARETDAPSLFAESGKKDAARGKAADVKTGRRPKLYGADDEQWAEQVKREIAAKKGGGAARARDDAPPSGELPDPVTLRVPRAGAGSTEADYAAGRLAACAALAFVAASAGAGAVVDALRSAFDAAKPDDGAAPAAGDSVPRCAATRAPRCASATSSSRSPRICGPGAARPSPSRRSSPAAPSSPRRPSRRSRGSSAGLPGDDDVVRGELVNAGVAFLDGAAGAGGVAAPLAVLERALGRGAGGAGAGERRRRGAAPVTGGAIMGGGGSTLKRPGGGAKRGPAQPLLGAASLRPKPKAAPGRGAAPSVKKTVKKKNREAGQVAIADGLVPLLEAALDAGEGINAKHGALSAVERLAARLGVLFEPYEIALLPFLLRAFSEGSDVVRDAAKGAARKVFEGLSAHGVKLAFPAVLGAASGDGTSNWRARVAAIDMLGATAHCAPKQLGAVLPRAVPALAGALADTSAQVRDAAKAALDDVASVARNPEVKALKRELIEALVDPAHATREALDALLGREFAHALDAPSLALLAPILQRGLRDRAAETKRRAALVAGNLSALCSGTAQATAALAPHMPALQPLLEAAAVGDAHPDVRSAAARALAQIVGALGEVQVPFVVERLVNAALGCRSSDATVDGGDILGGDAGGGGANGGLLGGAASGASERSGAAQALSLVLNELGEDRVATCLTSSLAPLGRQETAAGREGALWCVRYLARDTAEFSPLVGDALGCVLDGLADDADPVREVALLAGKQLVRSHGREELRVLLPSLEARLLGTAWRIRAAAAQLIGELLCLVGDAKPVGVAAAVEVWKTVVPNRAAKRVIQRRFNVPNTPRALRDILPVLVARLVAMLTPAGADGGAPRGPAAPRPPADASSDDDDSGDEDLDEGDDADAEKQRVASRALGDVVKKIGDRVVPELVPLLRESFAEGDEATRVGVCLGLAEAHAALAFHALYGQAGRDAVDAMLPGLLRRLDDDLDDGDGSPAVRARQALRDVLRRRSRELLPLVVPALLKRPIGDLRCAALSAVADVAGGPLSPFVSSAYGAAFDAEQQATHLDFTRVTLASAASDARWKQKRGDDPLPALSEDPRCLKALLPSYLRALLQGSPEARESAALGLGELVDLSSEAALKPLAIKVAGPLIRVVGDRFAAPVKAAILGALSALLRRGPLLVKAFVPQLQATPRAPTTRPRSSSPRCSAPSSSSSPTWGQNPEARRAPRARATAGHADRRSPRPRKSRAALA
ncbi:protein kinase regulator [Aureococcus anophagefferens]|nr:protein kinase regulator [Aureococcus anophagefferens]